LFTSVVERLAFTGKIRGLSLPLPGGARGRSPDQRLEAIDLFAAAWVRFRIRSSSYRKLLSRGYCGQIFNLTWKKMLTHDLLKNLKK
jgi:hypothetical protein